MQNSSPTRLIEHVSDWHTELDIDRDGRIVRNVALTGVTSRNGYRYSEPALREAVQLYEHKPVFLDHARNTSRPHERSTRDLAGTIIEARFEDGRIRGDIRVLETESGRTFLALSESNAPGVGMSHVVMAQRSTEGDVERIVDVVSVDAVVFPATTTTFREAVHANDDAVDTVHETDVDEPAEANDDTTFVAAEQETLRHRVRQLLNERDELIARLRDIDGRRQQEVCEREVQRLIAEAALPEFALTNAFRQQLVESDDRTRQALITERLRLIAAARQQRPHSAERFHSRTGTAADHAFVTAVRSSASG